MIKKQFIILAFLFAVILTPAGQSQTRTITDMGGRKVQVPAHISKVYIDKHCAMIVYAIAPEIAVNYVFELSNEGKQYIPSGYYEGKLYTSGSVEEIIKLNPDIVLMSDEISPSVIDKADKLQAQIKIPVVLLEMNMFGYKKNLTFLGDLLSKKQKADELIDFVKNYLDQIQERDKHIPEKERIKVYYAEGPDGLSTDPSGSKHSQILDFIGAVNVAKVGIIQGKGLSVVSMEQVMVWEPSVILTWTGGAESLVTYRFVLTDPLWAKIKAVKNHQVYQIPWLPFGWFDRPPGTNRILGTIWTANVLYPKIFNFDMIKISQEYFRKFYHFNLSEAEATKLLNPQPIL
jgi:iron complex transport system substrate-binding protein